MRVLQVVQALPPHTYGGSELYTAGVAEALADRGHDVAVAAPHGGETVDVPTFDLPAPETVGVQDDAGLPATPVDPAVDRRFEELLAGFDPDVVHLQHLKGLSSTLPARCAERGVACVLTLHDFWALCHREQLYRPDGVRCSGPESVEKCTDCYLAAEGVSAPGATDGTARDSESAPGLATRLDGSTPVSAANSESPETSDAVREQYRAVVAQREDLLSRALARTDCLVAPSSFLREVFVDHGSPPEDVVHLRNGVRVDRFEDTGFDGAPVRVGYAGRVAPEKGVHLLVEAFERVDGDATLDVFGRFAPDEEAYHARLADRAGEDVEFHGWYEDPAEPYRAVDVLALPSVWYENSPLVVQEAHAAGLPVVTADVGGMAELVADGVDGLTFGVGDADALADRLSAVVDDPATVEQLRAGVTEPTRLGDHAAALESLYADCGAA